MEKSKKKKREQEHLSRRCHLGLWLIMWYILARWSGGCTDESIKRYESEKMVVRTARGQATTSNRNLQTSIVRYWNEKKCHCLCSALLPDNLNLKWQNKSVKLCNMLTHFFLVHLVILVGLFSFYLLFIYIFSHFILVIVQTKCIKNKNELVRFDCCK